MASSGKVSTAALARLRYFRYLPPMGGFGGDWDTLDGDARIDGDAELARVLAALGYRGPPPPKPGPTYLGLLEVDGVGVTVSVERAATGEYRLHLSAGVYITDAQVAQVERLEARLDALGVPMQPGP